jgi:hypothetical protein
VGLTVETPQIFVARQQNRLTPAQKAGLAQLTADG